MNKTKIEYLDYTWNPITMLCDPVSDGCKNCWHRRRAAMLSTNPKISRANRHAYAGFDPILVKSRIDDPLKIKKPSMVGVQFMGDLFHDKVKEVFILRIWQAMGEFYNTRGEIQPVYDRPDHTYLVLTKRPKRALDFLSRRYPGEWARNNVWFGVSIEDQKTADERIPILLQIPAAVRFVSVEPMLEQINIESYLNRIAPHNHDFNSCPDGCPDQPFINWVIAGPETGPGARPCPPGAIENLYEQCKAAGVPFFDKRPDYLAREFPK